MACASPRQRAQQERFVLHGFFAGLKSRITGVNTNKYATASEKLSALRIQSEVEKVLVDMKKNTAFIIKEMGGKK